MLETEPHKMRRKLLRMCLKLWTKATLRWSFFAKIVNCFYSWALFVKKLRCKDIFIVCFNIVSSKVGTPLLWGNPPPPFLGTPSFWSKFKKLIPSFWEPSKLVHANCKNTLKRRCYVSDYTKSIEKIINITLFNFRLNSVFTTDTFFG